VRDRKLLALMALVTLLVTAHNIDHVLRDGLTEWQDLLTFALVLGVIYGLIGLAFVLYWRQRIGPRFLTLAALGGFGFGWLAHFSPYTDQPPSYILNAYASPVAGWIALSLLLALMLSLALLALYGGYRWLLSPR
jgi:hypothetical protein